MLRKKMIRDIKQNLSQFITIFLMVFIGVMVYSGIESYMEGMKQTANNFYTQNNLQDLNVMGSLSKENIETIKQIDNVKNAEGKLNVSTVLDDNNDITLSMNFIESNEISKFYIIEGKEFDANTKGVWLDNFFAQENNLKIGDTLKIKYDGYVFEEEVVGFINVPDHLYDVKDESQLYPDHKTFGFAYASTKELEKYIKNNNVGFKSISAYEYYKSAKEFSEWVNNNLGNITQKDVIKTDSNGNSTIGNDTNYLSENTGNSKIFATSGKSDNDPMLSNSIFNNHRIAIIRKSIETNLTTAIANYNTQSGSNYEYVMPVINDVDWYKIVNNVSIAAFMQGIPIGQKYFNNYSVITNTKNEEVINSQSIYILEQTNGSDLEYHQIGCEKLLEKVKKAKADGTLDRKQFTMTAYTDLSFLRQTVKVSETKLEYFYPHGVDNSNISGSANFKYLTGCYNCIVNSNADYNIDGIIKGEIKDYLTGKTLYNKNNFELEAVRKTYLTGLARERYDLYKSNFDLR